jgi:antitoxin (DNA-binding transcriptional repressor) of toxin-antitoxin stability system
MKELSVRDMRANIGRLDELVAAEGELVICRHGRPIARVLPMAQHRKPPDHADLRSCMAPLQAPSAGLIRAERDER